MVMTRTDLENKIKEILEIDEISTLINHQINRFTTEYKYKNIEIARALYYFYVVQDGDINNAKGIAIVPYVMQDAKKYFITLELERKRKTEEAQKSKKKEKLIITCTNPPKSKRKKKVIQIQDIKEEDND